MDYKSLLTSMTLIAICIFTLACSAYSQHCEINKVNDKLFYFTQSGLISEMYEKIKANNSNSYQIMLINFFGQINRKEAFYILIDSSKKFNIVALTADSVLFSGYINTTEKYQADFLFNENMVSSFLMSKCTNISSSHKKSVLLVSINSNNQWIEYVSLDGYMKEALTENGNYTCLKSCYALIEKVFKDFHITITK